MGAKIGVCVRANGNKYGAVKTIVDDIVFASKKEAARYCVLRLLERQGVIKDLRLQVPFEFRHNDILICKYQADFTYKEDGREIVEDAKGKATREYRIKKKLMRAFFAIEILET